MISLSVHLGINRLKQYKSEKLPLRPGFPMRKFVRRVLVVAAILFPVLAFLFFTFSESAYALTSMI